MSDYSTSEDELITRFLQVTAAGGAIIQIRTREVLRAATILRKSILSQPDTYHHVEWDIVNGFRNFTMENFTAHQTPPRTTNQMAGHIVEALGDPLQQIRNNKSEVNTGRQIHCYVFLDPDQLIERDPMSLQLLQQYASILPSCNVCIALITGPTTDLTAAGLPMGLINILDMPTPTIQELETCLRGIIDDLPDDQSETFEELRADKEAFTRIARLGLGLTQSEFEMHVALAIIQATESGQEVITEEDISQGVLVGKTEVVKQSDILELYPAESMDHVGGMQRLKDWLGARADCFGEDAQEFGIQRPKGLALFGVPGVGKSLVAKAIAGAWEIPLIRLDFSRVFSKFIGDSESRLRQALAMVERMDRVVLFVDEIDKGLGGISSGSGSSDGGVSSRILGTFLTWMQENKSQSFVVITANRIEGLPPELLRRGRMDALFFAGLPEEHERREVLRVHLERRGRSIEDHAELDIKRFLKASQDYVPAEIESAVNDALVLAFNDPKAEDLEIRHLIDALNSIVPIAKTSKAQITALCDWAKDNAISVSYSEEESKPTGGGTNARRMKPRRTH